MPSVDASTCCSMSSKWCCSFDGLVLVVDARLNGVHVGYQGWLVNRTWKMLAERQARPTSWLSRTCTDWCVPSVTTGVTVKFSAMAARRISHSSLPGAPRSLAASFTATSE